jgi:hypothetical protein
MQINFVAPQVMDKMNSNTTRSSEIITLKEEIVQTLLLKYYLKEVNLREIQLGITIIVVRLDHG